MLRLAFSTCSGRSFCKGVRRLSAPLRARKRELKDNVVVLEGVRTPFCDAASSYYNTDAYELASAVMKGVADRNHISKDQLEYCIFGSVVQEMNNTNIARDALVHAGYPVEIPAHTVNMTAASSLCALVSAFTMVKSGSFDGILAGGVGFSTNAPILLSKPWRRAIMDYAQDKSILTFLGHLCYRIIDTINIGRSKLIDFSSGRSTIDDCGALMQKFGVDRKRADYYAAISHNRAIHCVSQHTDIIPVYLKSGELVERDNHPHPVDVSTVFFHKDYTDESLGPDSYVLTSTCVLPETSRRCCDDITECNYALLSDGASATIVISEEKALKLGKKPKAYIRDYIMLGCDSTINQLMSPFYAVPELLIRHNLTFNDIHVVEIHEGFAAQTVAFIEALNNKKFLEEFVGVTRDLGTLDLVNVNTWGGSIALGHPLSATGIRLVNMAVNRLHYEDKRWALVSSCSEGGQGVVILLEKYPQT